MAGTPTLIDIPTAAAAAHRPEGTIRQWLSTGVLTPHGTRAARRVDLAEVLHVATRPAERATRRHKAGKP